jgi:hypothetical protein
MVHYTGWTTDGKMFDSSVAWGEPATFPLNGSSGMDRRRAIDGGRRKDSILIPEPPAHQGKRAALPARADVEPIRIRIEAIGQSRVGRLQAHGHALFHPHPLVPVRRETTTTRN